MNYKYILKEIKKANKYILEAYQSLNYYKDQHNKKYYNYCEFYITEANEILTNLEIDTEIKLESNKDE